MICRLSTFRKAVNARAAWWHVLFSGKYRFEDHFPVSLANNEASTEVLDEVLESVGVEAWYGVYTVSNREWYNRVNKAIDDCAMVEWKKMERANVS